MKPSLKARSPAKLILSGEHAVVYGKPAIAMAINRYAESTIISSISNITPVILFHCLNLKYAKSFTLQTLKIFRKRLQNKYHDFLNSRCGIREVLKTPFELLQYTVTHLLETLNIPLSQGLEIHSTSNIPIGCGMGSSSAVVMSTLYALAHFFKIDIDPSRYLSLGREAENLQHGYSSGLDLQLAMSGGCLRYEEGQILKRLMPNFPLMIVQTGVPDTTTGQCVSSVAKYFKQGSMSADFASITNGFDQALQSNDFIKLQEYIRLNHRLLVSIGVVPQKVQAFIKKLEAEGAAAKICGAGSVAGEKAGVVLLVSEKDLSPIAEEYGYRCQQVQGDFRGTHLL
jgi:mevalonate kinase